MIPHPIKSYHFSRSSVNVIKKMPIINKLEKIEEKVMIPSRGKKDVLLLFMQYLGEPGKMDVGTLEQWVSHYNYTPLCSQVAGWVQQTPQLQKALLHFLAGLSKSSLPQFGH